MFNRFQTHARSLGLPTEQPVVLAVSGGLDSTVLAHLVHRAGWPFVVAHCNFGLRGAESDRDAVFVGEMAARYGVPFFEKTFDTTQFAHENGLSTQMAARELRYTWFAELCAEHHFAATLTAHHLNDAVETLLLNLLRGTGLRGLTGVRRTANGQRRTEYSTFDTATRSPYTVSRTPYAVRRQPYAVRRPLLFATRADLEAYAATEGLEWREDASNATDDYARNAVRRHVVPRLLDVNPAFLQTAERTLQRLADTQSNLEWLLAQHLNVQPDATAPGVYFVEKEKVSNLPAPAVALREWLREWDFTPEQCRQIAEGLDHVGLSLHSNAGARLVVDRRRLLLDVSALETPDSAVEAPPILIQDDDLMVRLPEGGRLFLTPTDPTPPWPDGREAVVVDMDLLRFPLTLRRWQAGDTFQPLGMGGQHQKLHDFLTNQKLSRLEKDATHVLLNADGSVIWVVGHRPDERFKITPNTRKALKITFNR